MKFQRVVAMSIAYHVCFANIEAPFFPASSTKGLVGDRSVHSRNSSPQKSPGTSKSKNQIETKTKPLEEVDTTCYPNKVRDEIVHHQPRRRRLEKKKTCRRMTVATIKTSTSSSTIAKVSPSTIHHPTTTKTLRLQREWKDTIASGMGFDWKKGRPVRYQHDSSSRSTGADDDSQISSYLWLGPIQSMDRWHFSFVGFGDPYEMGVYHGVVVVPPDYPHGPPKIQLWTPSGRFHTHKDLCLDVSNYHPESWRPTLSIRSLVESVRLHMATPADAAIGSLGDCYEKRQSYAQASRRYTVSAIPGRSHTIIDHGKMIRNGWMKGIRLSRMEEEGDEDDTYDIAITATAPSSLTLLLDEVLLQKPFRLFLAGAFCLLFIVLHLR